MRDWRNNSGIKFFKFKTKIKGTNAYRLELTTAGKTLYQKASKLLNEVAELQQAAEHIALGNEISVTIAIEASFDLKGILPLLENLQNQFPNTQIIIAQEYLSGAIEAMFNGRATLCITPSADFLDVDSKVDKRLLTTGMLVNVASPRLVNRHAKIHTRRDLLNECQIIVKDSGKGSKDSEWGVQDGQRRWYVNDYSTKKMLIENAMGWGRLPGFLAEQGLKEGRLLLLGLSDVQNEAHLGYFIMKNKSKPLGPVAQAVWEQFEHYTFNSL